MLSMLCLARTVEMTLDRLGWNELQLKQWPSVLNVWGLMELVELIVRATALKRSNVTCRLWRVK